MARSANFPSSSLRVARAQAAVSPGQPIQRDPCRPCTCAKAVAKPKEGERWLLVTSAYHMPRSMGLFRRAGFKVEAYPVDRRASRSEAFSFFSVAIGGLERTDVAMREWIGLTAYWLTGKTDHFVSGPDQFAHDSGTDKTGCSCNKNTHREILLVI